MFTDLIKPKEEAKPATAPAAQQAAKMPLPARDTEGNGTENKAAEKKDEAKPAAPAPPAAKPAAPKPAPAPAAKEEAKKPAPPAKAPAAEKAKEEPKKATPAKPAEKKVAENTEKKTAPAPVKADEKKVAAEAKKPAPAKAKEEAAKAAPGKPEAVAKKSDADSWNVSVGSYVLEEALAADMGKVRKAGLEPVVKSATRKKSAMNRLFVADYPDRPAAQSALEKLQRQTSDAFVIEQSGKFSLFAGSYLQPEAAASEKERLKAAGIAVTVKQSEIAIPSQSLTVGPFKTKKAADAALAKLKSAGLKATLTQK